MRIELTVEHDQRAHDVSIEAAPDVSLRDVTAAVASSCGTRSPEALWCEGTALQADAAWSRAGLHTGSIVTTAAPAGRAAPAAALSMSVVAGPDAGRTVPLSRGRLTIGRGAHCDLVLDDPDTSRMHAAITVDGTGITVRDLGSTNGTSLDGALVSATEDVAVGVGAHLRIGESTLSITGPGGPPAITTVSAEGTVHVIRPPRRMGVRTHATITVPVAGSDSRPRPVQWVTALLPAAAGGVLVWVTGSVEFLLFTLLSPVMILSGALGDRLHWRRSRRRAAATFTRECADAAERIDTALAREIRSRRQRCPDPAAVGRIAVLPTDRLWERARADDDLLTVRLGTGQMPSATLVDRAGRTEPAGELADVPICVDLRDGPLGVAGPDVLVDGCTRWLVAQLATHHSPADVELVLMLAASARRRWRWTRWLPHLAGRVVAPSRWADTVDELGVRLRQQAADTRAGVGWSGRWTVLVLDRDEELADVPGLSDLLREGTAIGVTALVVARDGAALPSACVSVASVDGESATRLTLRRSGVSAERAILADTVGPAWACALARSLAPMADGGPGGPGTLPDACTLADVHGRLECHSLHARWAASPGSARTTVGAGADGPLMLDLAADGPHALIAGTTGSGKSELLQALVVGLALDQSPDELNLLLIDYKGGAAFRDCARLPHTAGVVTDLDPYLTGRALRSLRSELRRRERLLNEFGAVDLSTYRRTSSSTAIPRLVIVVDEFAALAEDLPDFVPGLVAVAQRGRSLGVHLVLATQRPGSAVSAEIRANAAMRIALRVTDAAESSDVIDAPDALTIPRSTPGRAYVRIGSTLRPVQSAWPGARTRPSTEKVRVDVLDEWRRPRADPARIGEDTDLSGLVDVVDRAASEHGLARATAPWTPPLGTDLTRPDLPTPGCSTSVVFGIADVPDEQRHEPVELDLLTGQSLLVLGAPRSGRTTTLASIAVGAAHQLPPDRLDIYGVDMSGSLIQMVSRLPHHATCLDGHDPDLVLRLLNRLEDVCAERARPFGQTNSLGLLLIDDWDAVTASLRDLDSAACADALTRLLRAAPSAGVSVVVSGGRSLLSPRHSGGFARRLALHLSDITDYATFGLSPRDVPAPMPPGRAVRSEDAAVVQMAAPSTARTAADAGDAHPSMSIGDVEAIRRRWIGHHPSRRAVRVRPLPAVVQFSEVVAQVVEPSASGPAAGHPLLLGVAGDDATPLSIDIAGHPGHLIVAGPPRSGRSTVLRLLYRQARQAGLATIVAAGPRSPLAIEARADNLDVLDPCDPADPRLTPSQRSTLVLVDDSELWIDSELGELIAGWLRRSEHGLSAIVAGRSEDLATTYRGVGAEARRSQRGILLRPGPIDGELVGVRLPRRPSTGPPGRGVMIGDPSWDPRFVTGEPVPVQIANIDDQTTRGNAR